MQIRHPLLRLARHLQRLFKQPHKAQGRRNLPQSLYVWATSPPLVETFVRHVVAPARFAPASEAVREGPLYAPLNTGGEGMELMASRASTIDRGRAGARRRHDSKRPGWRSAASRTSRGVTRRPKRCCAGRPPIRLVSRRRRSCCFATPEGYPHNSFIMGKLWTGGSTRNPRNNPMQSKLVPGLQSDALSIGRKCLHCAQ
jgi:hypothetical protein